MSGREIIDALRCVYEACEAIRNADACEGCPLHREGSCLDVTTFSEVCEDVTVGQFDELIGFAKDVEERISDEDWDAYWADRRREDDYDKEWGYGY